MRKVTENVYVETAYPGANVGLIVSDRGLVMVDSPYQPESAVDFAGQIKKISDKEVVYLINTDHHFDHVACGGFFTRNIVLQELSLEPFEISRLAARDRTEKIRAEGGELKDVIARMEPPRPHIVFSDKISFDMGNLTVRAVHTGGHALGTSYVYIPEERVVFCGDNVVNGRFPYMSQGIYRTWARALRQILELDAEVVIPGHEDVGDKEPVRKLLKFMEDLEGSLKELFYEIHVKHNPPKGDGDLIRFFPGIEGWPKPDERAQAEVIRRMYEQCIGQPIGL
ncbi:MAG: MBL fold metallo-hydrolase [bacterium]